MRYAWPLFQILTFSSGAYAAEQVFDDSLLLSRGIIASSQAHQVNQLNCEVAGIMSRGNMLSKVIDLTLEARAQGSAFHCGQSLEQRALVIGVKGRIMQTTLDGVIVRYETVSTTASPYIAFQVTPGFSLGISQEIKSEEVKNQVTSAAGNSQRLLLSGTWHDGPWEATLSYADRYRESPDSIFNVPRSLGFAFRQKLSTLLSVGLVYTKIDHPGVASGDDSPEFEHNYAAVIASRLTDDLSVEFSIMHTNAVAGTKNSEDNLLSILGQYALNDQWKIGGFIKQLEGDSKAYDITISEYGFTIALSR